MRGLTIIELMISVSILVVILGVTLVVLNPAKQLSAARNSQRKLHLNSILNAVYANLADTRTGSFVCVNGDIPTTTKKMTSGGGGFDIAPCLIPSYINSLPFDPLASSSYYESVSNYDTGYLIVKSTSTGEITLSAPFTEGSSTISVTR